MKLKSLQLNNIEDIIFIGRYHDIYTKVYYQDQHYEIFYLTITRFLKQLNHNQNIIKLYKNQYHSPISIDNVLFSPTKNIKHSDCEYFNLLKIDEKNPYFEKLLEDRQLFTIAVERFLEYKRIELNRK